MENRCPAFTLNRNIVVLKTNGYHTCIDERFGEWINDQIIFFRPDGNEEIKTRGWIIDNDFGHQLVICKGCVAYAKKRQDDYYSK